MIKNFKKSVYLLALPVLCLATSCTQDNLDYENSQATEALGDGNVTLRVRVQDPSQIMAAANESPEILVGDGNPDSGYGLDVLPFRISDGSNVDLLAFSVYEGDSETGEFNLARQFQKSVTPVKGFTPGDGQNILEINGYPMHMEIQLVLDPTKYYKVAFWAQSSKCDAYDFSNLENVKVKYGTEKETIDGKEYWTGYINNDELRDAFCKVLYIPKGKTGTIEAVLRRPFAQLNVGTAGYDYEGAAALEPSATSYLYSKIAIEGVAQAYNVLDAKSLTVDENDESTLTNVIFDYNRLPAFVYYDADGEDAIKQIPYADISRDALLTIKHSYNEDDVKLSFNQLNANGFYPYVPWQRFRNYKNAAGDEFSNTKYFKNGVEIPADQADEDCTFRNYPKIVDTDDDGNVILLDNPDGLLEGETTENLYDDGRKLLTDVFKYLSMSYILVPEVGTGESGSENSNGVVKKVTFKTKGANSMAEMELFSIPNVPVQKNWRTNIISDNFYTVGHGFKLYIIPDYCGDFDYLYAGAVDYDTNTSTNDKDMWNVHFSETNDQELDYTQGQNGYTYDDWFMENFGDYYGHGSASGPEWKDDTQQNPSTGSDPDNND